MYHHLLVLTDNLEMAGRFNDIFSEIKHRPRITYGISSLSKSTEFSNRLGQPVTQFNLREEGIVSEILSQFDIVISVHFKQLFPASIVKSVKCINIHPGFNPFTRGWYPQVFAIIHGLPVGATIHEIDERLDHGGIIARSEVQVEYTDTSLTLYRKVLELECLLLKQFLPDILSGNYNLIKPESEGNLFLRKDFDNLLKLDLDETIKVKSLINKLRALTHGDFRNCYFVDPQDGKKIFLRLDLVKES